MCYLGRAEDLQSALVNNRNALQISHVEVDPDQDLH